MVIEGMKEEVRSWMRSGTLVFDLSRVVEELILNSLDAGATDVSVYVNVGTCFVKVEDDGYGISRDGLTLLGQRYVTSKHPEPSEKSFGSRGESLASISDVSLVEVITRTSGRPNGFRKLLKGSKCVYFGIDNDRKKFGTTVIVRDLFYNQPVRRKCLQSSLKKVLQSVKKCVFQISLVHEKTSFKVVDCESNEQLLDTRASSPFSLLLHGFGISDPNFLHKLNFSDGLLKIYGYISSPCHHFYSKVFQYIYINSRYTWKGKIHRLLNYLATSSDCYKQWRAENVSQKGKRSRVPANPSFILNLSCPLSFYDLSFEPSKTNVHFKDWIPILTFIEEAIQQIWRVTPKGCTADICANDEIWNSSDCQELIGEGDFKPGGLGVTKLNTFTLPLDPISSSLSESLSNSSSHCFEKRCEKPSAQYFNMHPFDSEELNPLDAAFDCDPHSAIECSSTREDKQNCLNFYDSTRGLSCASKTDCSAHRKRRLYGNEFAHPRSSKRTSISKNADSQGIFLCGMLESDSDNISCDLPGCSARNYSTFDIATSWHSGRFEFKLDNFKANRQQQSCCEGTDVHIGYCDSVRALNDWNDGPSYFPEINQQGSSDILLDGEITGTQDLGISNYADMPATMNDAGHEWREGNSKPKALLFRNVGQDTFPSPLLDFNNYQRSDVLISKSLGKCNYFLDIPSLNSWFTPKDTEVDWLIGNSHSTEDDTLGRGNDQVYLQLDHQPIIQKKITRRFSAPPFCKRKKPFVSLCYRSVGQQCEVDVPEVSNNFISTEIDCLQCTKVSPNHVDSFIWIGSCNKYEKDEDELEVKIDKGVAVSSNPKGFITKGLDYSIPNEYNFTAETNTEATILDMTSGIFHQAGCSLIPGPSTKYLLEDTRVLQQVDKKFIPVVAGTILSLVDQHAADERIRLEEFHEKVLNGESRTITYLDAEQQLTLPELGYQLLLDYGDKIRDWGWICDVDTSGSETFKRSLNVLHQQAAAVRLVAVPNVLGVNLTDEDLIEFLQLLADTDGSSPVPPSVHRILNSKACRGAIMFGDTLLQSECALIIEELKQTSLCFQCAHGRPTTAPLVNLKALHEQIAELAPPGQPWHGLQRHRTTLDRAEHRLNLARS